ncbi:MAG: arginase family protein, partial [Bdellovibrionales bacterium]|nr:arginase family protein [Bdellovibrionales bacterium]
LCPGTGTPVPGGLSFAEYSLLLKEVALSGRTIIGFDLMEVSPTDDDRQWNGNVGMRVLAKLCGWTAVSNGWLKAQNLQNL